MKTKLSKKLNHVLKGAILCATLTLTACQVPLDIASLKAEESNFSISVEQAEASFKALKEICDQDDGKMWGMNLYGPMLIINPENFDVAANEPDDEGLLHEKGQLYIGKFDKNLIVANSVTHFGAKDWGMVRWPLPEDNKLNNKLLVHELFHYQQKALGMVGEEMWYDNSHMDTMEARISIQMEWNALFTALKTKDEERKAAIKDALAIRTQRRLQFSSAEHENKFEISEGMADYTAERLCNETEEELLHSIENNIRYALDQPSLVRNFAYVSGTLYGVLLDDSNPDWKKDIQYNSDLGQLLAKACLIEGVDEVAELSELSKERKEAYQYDEIYEKELKIKEEKDKLVEAYKAQFEDKPILSIRLQSLNFAFNPNQVQPLPGMGTVYECIEIKDIWGTLTVATGGCLLSEDYRTVTVPAVNLDINAQSVKSDNWKLTLHEGFEIKQDGENYILSMVQ